jgi:putative transposase
MEADEAAFTAKMLTLKQSSIVNRAARSGPLSEYPLLVFGGVKPEGVAALQFHVATHRLLGLWLSTMEYRTGRHCVFALHVHLVFVTKFRRDVLSELAIRDLAAIFAKVCRDFEAELVECSGEDDHVHLLVSYPPKVMLSKLVNSLKGVSSRLLREVRPEICGRYYKGVLWSPSYFAASCGGAPISIIRQYIEQQRSAVPPRPEGRGFPAQRG